jgi:hypothetical protein
VLTSRPKPRKPAMIVRHEEQPLFALVLIFRGFSEGYEVARCTALQSKVTGSRSRHPRQFGIPRL